VIGGGGKLRLDSALVHGGTGGIAGSIAPDDDSDVIGGTGRKGIGTDVMADLARAWGAADPRHGAVSRSLPGLRVLRQDPIECLFSFLCSSNNNIPRINLILARLRAKYGTLVGSLAGQDYYSFPTVEALAAAEDADLRALGLGYRARFVRETALHIVSKGGRQYLEDLAALPVHHEGRIKVQEALCECVGVGRKVADCVALFSLGRCDAVPVDTHVWSMACRDFEEKPSAGVAAEASSALVAPGAASKPSIETDADTALAPGSIAVESAVPYESPSRSNPRKKKKKQPADAPLLKNSAELRAASSLTPRVYDSVGELFRGRYGSHAGWAHCVLFAAELPAFRRWLDPELADAITRFEVEERARNKEKKAAAKARTAARKAAKTTQLGAAQGEGEGKSRREMAEGLSGAVLSE